ncbi:MAG TPA: flagellar protein FlaG [Bacillota bacterium]
MRVDKIHPDFQKTEGSVQHYKRVEPQERPEKHETSPTPLDRKKQEEKSSGENWLQVLSERVRQLNETLRIFDKRLRFDIHEETRRIMVKVINAETEEVLREIPPEKILDLVASIEKAIGLIVDERI